MWDKWVIDATMGYPLCFCPVEGDIDSDDFEIVTGFNMLGAPPEGEVVALVHADGQEATDAFYAEHKDEIDKALGKTSE